MEREIKKKVSELAKDFEKCNLGSLIILENNSDEIMVNARAISDGAIITFIESILLDSEFALNEVVKIIGNIILAKEFNKQFNMEHENTTLH
jgi:hypothetical protein